MRIAAVQSASAALPESRPVPVRRPALIIALHWATVFALLAATVLVLTREGVEAKPLRAFLLDGHRSFGLIVLCAAFARLAARILHYPLGSLSSLPRPLRLAADATHGLLYALLFALPLLGLALSGARGNPVTLFGLGPLPALLQRDLDLADVLADYHVWAAWALLALVSLHALAALWHHFVHRDPVLTAMLPARPARARPDLSLRNPDSTTV